MSELEGPDPESKCPSDDGRRVVRFEDEKGRGLRLPSYKSRRNRYLATDRKRSEREREEAEVTPRHDESRSVTPRHDKFALEQSRAEQIQSKSETEQNTKRARAGKFVSPSVEEVEAYAVEKGLALDAAYFVDFFEAKGWMTGKVRMSMWKAAVRNAARDGWTIRKVVDSATKPPPRTRQEYDLAAEEDQIQRNREADANRHRKEEDNRAADAEWLEKNWKKREEKP